MKINFKPVDESDAEFLYEQLQLPIIIIIKSVVMEEPIVLPLLLVEEALVILIFGLMDKLLQLLAI